MRARPGARVGAPHLGKSITGRKGILGQEAGARAGKVLCLSQAVRPPQGARPSGSPTSSCSSFPGPLRGREGGSFSLVVRNASTGACQVKVKASTSVVVSFLKQRNDNTHCKS